MFIHERQKRYRTQSLIENLRAESRLATSELIDEALQVITDTPEHKRRRVRGLAKALGEVASTFDGFVAEDSEGNTLMWVPYTLHNTTGLSKRRDGYVTDGRSHSGLDVAAATDTCCVTNEERDLAIEEWVENKVLLSEDIETHGAPTLVVPSRYLSRASLAEALNRHFVARLGYSSAAFENH